MDSASQGDPNEPLILRIAQLTRQMREGLRELGLDKGLAVAAEAIPDARQRLAYIARMTEQAAERTLNAVDQAMPLQERLGEDARDLAQRWDGWFAQPIELTQARDLVQHTRAFLAQVPTQSEATHAQLMEIMMAQDFQDLTGQVIKKMMAMIEDVEMQLLQLLIDHAPPERRPAAGLLNGPQLEPGQPEALDGQAQVDDLLASLGF